MYTSRPHRSPSSQFLVAAGDRIAIVAGLAFLDGVASGVFGANELRGWIETHLVRARRMTWTGEVHEIGFRALNLTQSPSSPPGLASAPQLPGLISVARKRVILALRGLLGTPLDDRFLNAAIYGNRVKRDATATGGGWIPGPSSTDALSDIVLSLFAADILSHRDTYERGLCICDACGRVWFDPTAQSRQTCAPGTPHYVTVTGGSLPPPSSGNGPR